MEEETAPQNNKPVSNNADTNVNWTNRRFMAYVALFSLVGLALVTIVLGIISIQLLEAMIPILSVFIMAFSTIVGGYMGLATYADKWLITKK